MQGFNRKEKEKKQEDGNSYIVDCHINCAGNQYHNHPLFEKLDEDPDDGRLRVRLVNYVIIAKETLTPEMVEILQPLFDNKL